MTNKMLTLLQRTRLKSLKKTYGHTIAAGKQQGFDVGSTDEEILSTLEAYHLSAQVAELLNDFVSRFGGNPSDAMLALGIVFQTAANGLTALHKQDPELALRLGSVVQSQLEQALSGDKDDGTTEDRPGG